MASTLGRVLAGFVSVTTVTALLAGTANAADEGLSATGGDLIGLITGADGSVVPWATVRALSVDGEREWEAMTGEDGKYSIQNLPDGMYQVGVSSDAWGTQFAYGKLTRDEARQFRVRAGEVRVVDETMLPQATLKVTIVDSVTGKRITRGCVSLNVPPHGVCAASGGVFTIVGIPYGSVDVEVRPGGTHWSTTTTVSLQPGETRALTVAVEPATAIVTTVQAADTGAPVAGVCVDLAYPDRHGFGPAYGQSGCSEADGRLVIGPLSGEIRAQIFAHHLNGEYGAQWVAASGGTGDQRKAKWFTAKAGKIKKIPALRMDPPGSISGVVSSKATGEPVVGICGFPYAVQETHSIGRHMGKHCSAADGSYTISGLGPYAWPVQHVALREGYAWHWSGGSSDRFSADYVQVTPGQTGTANVSLAPAGTITGQVTTPDGDPVWGGLSVYNARTGDLAAVSAGVEMDGTFVIDSLGAQKVKVSYSVPGYGSCYYLNAPDFASATPITVKAGKATTGINLVACPATE